MEKDVKTNLQKENKQRDIQLMDHCVTHTFAWWCDSCWFKRLLVLKWLCGNFVHTQLHREPAEFTVEHSHPGETVSLPLLRLFSVPPCTRPPPHPTHVKCDLGYRAGKHMGVCVFVMESVTWPPLALYTTDSVFFSLSWCVMSWCTSHVDVKWQWTDQSVVSLCLT